MSTRIDYNKIIKYVEESKKDVVEINQKVAKTLANNEIPKSVFDKRYLANGKNELARYIKEKEYEFVVIEPKIIIKKKK